MSKSANIEVELELTYLVRQLPVEVTGVTPMELTDIYVPEDSSRPRLRLRKKGNEYEITKKVPVSIDDLSNQTEQTIPLTPDEFKALAASSKRQVRKDRYRVVISGRSAEVDVFKDALNGLVLIDFEFSNAKDMRNFTPPRCCLADVTQELFVAGGQLAGATYKDIESDLNRYNYTKIVA